MRLFPDLVYKSKEWFREYRQWQKSQVIANDDTLEMWRNFHFPKVTTISLSKGAIRHIQKYGIGTKRTVKHAPIKKCVVCGDHFRSDRPKATMCSDKCRKLRSIHDKLELEALRELVYGKGK